jgi:hypothetical protein
MSRTRSQPATTETIVSLLVLTVLVVTAAGVFIKQSRYDASLFHPVELQITPADSSSSSADGVLDLQAYLPDGMTPLTSPEAFGTDTLSDKINGKAELYLSAGFVNLQCQRFAVTGRPDLWVELFLYQMGNAHNAYAVFSAQRRADAVQVPLTRHAYRTPNGLFFVQGSDYVEIIAATAVPELTEKLMLLGGGLIRGRPAAATQLDELVLLPAENLDENTITLLAADVFGFDRLDNVLVASYHPHAGSVPLTAFVSLRGTDAEAAQLADAYHRFLLENGGSDVPLEVALPGGRCLQLFDTFEVVFSRGRLLAGVHEAASREGAQALAARLYQHLAEADQ